MIKMASYFTRVYEDKSVPVFTTRSNRRGVSNSLIVGYLPPTETTPDLIPLIIHLPRKIDILLSFFRRLFRTTCIASAVAFYVLSVCFLTIRGKCQARGITVGNTRIISNYVPSSIVIIANSCKRAKMRTRGEARTLNTFLGNFIRNLKGSVK